MIQRLSRARRRGQSGFTLIELLVVIIVLGILAAVVVFAVTGVGDKGKANAISIDARTIRTAEESFCSQNGRYGTTEELIEARLLSGTPEYNRVILDTSYGPCGNSNYVIGAPPATSPPATTECQDEAAWCDIASANGIPTTSSTGLNFNMHVTASGPTPMVELANGKILVSKAWTRTTAITTNPTCSANPCALPFQIFDPASGTKGTWSPVPPNTTFGATTPPGTVPNARSNPTPQNLINNMILIKGSSAWCGTNCGKVLLHVPTNNDGMIDPERSNWKLYDPNQSEPGTQSLGRWTALSTAAPAADGPYRRNWFNSFVQLTRTPCGNICGKVLIVGQGMEDFNFAVPTPPEPEIWDPADGSLGSFRKLTDSGYPATNFPSSEGSFEAPTLTLLNDGRVLFLMDTFAKVFDPVTEKFTDVAPTPPGFEHNWKNDKAVVLPEPGGRVLVTEGARMFLFSPSPGTGSWTPVPTCGDTVFCRIVTTLPDGRVLAKRVSVASGFPVHRTQPSVPLFLFDPTKITDPAGPWVQITSVTPATAGTWGIPIREVVPGSCGNLCNKVLTTESTGPSPWPAGKLGVSARIYTP